MIPRTVRYAALVGTLVAGSGCYVYVPLKSSTPPPVRGAAVRARLAEPGRFRLTDVTAENVSSVDGEVVEWNADRLVLSAFWVRSNSGLEHKGVGETVVLPRTTIATVERKQISLARSSALAGGIALLAVLANAAFIGGGGVEPPPGPPPPTQ